jgi:hypothetical protein
MPIIDRSSWYLSWGYLVWGKAEGENKLIAFGSCQLATSSERVVKERRGELQETAKEEIEIRKIRRKEERRMKVV